MKEHKAARALGSHRGGEMPAGSMENTKERDLEYRSVDANLT